MKKEYRFPFEGWHWDLKVEADNLEHAIKKFREHYKGDYDYEKIQELTNNK